MARSTRYRRMSRTPQRSPVNTIVNIIVVAWIAGMMFLVWPTFKEMVQSRLAGTTSAPGQAAPAPTLAPAQIRQLQQAAPQTAAEQQAVQQAVPTADVRTPPPLPAQATAASVVQPIVNRDEAQQYSPVDLGWAPLPTPTTMLSQEQYDDSQASEEQNFLNNAEQGLTEAQKLVRIHEAERQAQSQP
jgi:hypothetical protein